MKDIKKPEFMLEALKGRRGFIAILEILIAFVVFLMGTLAMGIIEVPLLLSYLMSDEEFMAVISGMSTGQVDTAGYYAQLQKMVMNIPEWVMIGILLAEIFLIGVIIIYCRFIEKRKLRTMGFTKNFGVQYLLGALGGTLFFSVAYLLCVVTGGIRFRGLAEDMAPMYVIGYLGGYMIQGMAEEVLCRGYLFVSLSRRNSVMYSAVLSAVFFSLLHSYNSGVNLLAFINIFLFGIFAALLLVHCENIWIVGAFHSLWNFTQGNLYGIQVSGNALQSSVFVSENRAGMEFINGGRFGVEGGIGVTIVLAAGIAWLLHVLNKEGKLIEWNGFRPETKEYNNYVKVPNGQAGAGNRYPQGQTGQQGNGYPQAPTSQPGNSYPHNPDQMMPAQPDKRVNMGTEPGQTPWRPENTPQEPENQFNADYFKK